MNEDSNAPPPLQNINDSSTFTSMKKLKCMYNVFSCIFSFLQLQLIWICEIVSPNWILPMAITISSSHAPFIYDESSKSCFLLMPIPNTLKDEYFFLHCSQTKPDSSKPIPKCYDTIKGKIFAIAKVLKIVDTKKDAIAYDDQTQSMKRNCKKKDRNWWLFKEIYIVQSLTNHIGSLGVSTGANLNELVKKIRNGQILIKKSKVLSQ